MVTIYAPPRTRQQRWAARYPRLWCRSCQSFRLHWTDADGAVKCARCQRVLITNRLEG